MSFRRSLSLSNTGPIPGIVGAHKGGCPDSAEPAHGLPQPGRALRSVAHRRLHGITLSSGPIRMELVVHGSRQPGRRLGRLMASDSPAVPVTPVSLRQAGQEATHNRGGTQPPAATPSSSPSGDPGTRGSLCQELNWQCRAVVGFAAAI
ncbi:hypothetical protein NDU88_002863 [Pleurodeles waltl]|uniref:Uncharacterized protein n=1 Tax=Pleurodeles waltl TaxID=8319 RepID=A0AAV7UAV5_PLEWA|nr:hypothetical protein NDU88_002863 [Pleurodeles waltl]